MPKNIFEVPDTFTLLQALDKMQDSASYLVDRFFKRQEIVSTDHIAVEYRKAGRILAPAVTTEAVRGVDIKRAESQAKWFTPAVFAPRRVTGLADIQKRVFGEVPNLYQKTPPEERLARLQAQDLVDLTRLHVNRREQMAAEMLQNGKVTLQAYSDEGKNTTTQIVNYDWSGECVPAVTWDNATATIYEDLRAASETIQRNCGLVPTVAVCGKNIETYLLSNTEIKNWLMLPNRENLTMASMQPQYISPEVRHIGRINALNLDLVSYVKSYTDENGQARPFIGDDNLILATEQIGRITFAPVTIFNRETAWQTIAAPLVPKYYISEENSTVSFTLYSKCVIIPDDVDNWITIKARG